MMTNGNGDPFKNTTVKRLTKHLFLMIFVDESQSLTLFPGLPSSLSHKKTAWKRKVQKGREGLEAGEEKWGLLEKYLQCVFPQQRKRWEHDFSATDFMQWNNSGVVTLTLHSEVVCDFIVVSCSAVDEPYSTVLCLSLSEYFTFKQESIYSRGTKSWRIYIRRNQSRRQSI